MTRDGRLVVLYGQSLNVFHVDIVQYNTSHTLYFLSDAPSFKEKTPTKASRKHKLVLLSFQDDYKRQIAKEKCDGFFPLLLSLQL